MRKFSTVLIILGLVVTIAILGLVAGWWGGAKPSPRPGTELSSDQPATETQPGEQKLVKTNPTTIPHPRADRTNRPPFPQTQPSNLLTNWEEKVDAILTGEEPENDKAKKMIEIFPTLPPDAQEEVAHHISNLTTDDNYAPLEKFLTNSALPEAVLEVFTEDVLNRPNTIKLPALLEIAQDSQHPKAGEAKDILELFLEEDFGADWTKWQARLDQWLKDNPD